MVTKWSLSSSDLQKMVAFLEDIIEIFRAAVADLSPNFYMGEGIKASPKKRLVGLQIFKGHNLIALKLFSVSVKFKSSFNFFPLLIAPKYSSRQSGIYSWVGFFSLSWFNVFSVGSVTAFPPAFVYRETELRCTATSGHLHKQPALNKTAWSGESKTTFSSPAQMIKHRWGSYTIKTSHFCFETTEMLWRAKKCK